MNLINLIIAICVFFATAEAAAVKNSSQEYYLEIQVKPGQSGKAHLNGLQLESYHIAAGENDAVFAKHNKYTSKGFLNGTNGKEGGVTYQNQVFDLGSNFPYVMLPEEYVNFYAAWEPVRVNGGSGASNTKENHGGFWINGTGLQWTSNTHYKPQSNSNAFAGWLVCDWWHGLPQLFFRIESYNEPAPCSCAEVWLCPVYI